MTPQHPDAESTVSPVVEVFWRPGCVFCMILRDDLERRSIEATWRNIWEDEDAADFVRSVNEGNEVVPTVRVGQEVRTNPAGHVVAELIAKATSPG